MRITSDINTISYSNRPKQQRNFQSNLPSNFPAFTSINPFKKNIVTDVFVNTDVKILSPKQIKKAKENVLNEIVALFKTPFTPAGSKRMEDLLNSPFADYTMKFGNLGFTLVDYINCGMKNQKVTPLYNQFLRTSLAKILPYELLDKEARTNLFYKNSRIFDIFQSYTKMNETSKEAQEIRDMILRMKENDVEIKEYPAFFADCLFNGKLEMCRFLEKHFNSINPETQIDLITGNSAIIDKFSNMYGTGTQIKLSSGEDDLLIYYPKIFDRDRQFGQYYNLTEYTISRNLWDMSLFSQDKNIRGFFDIPKYMFQLKDSYYERRCRSTTELLDKFYRKNVKLHPEIKTLDFVEKVAKYFLYNPKTKEVSDYYGRIDFLEKGLLHNESRALAKECFSKLEQISYFNNKEDVNVKILEGLYEMFAIRSGEKYNDVIKKLDSLNTQPMRNLGEEVFKVYENVTSVSMLNLQQKRELLEKLLNNKTTLVDCKLGDILDVKFLPKNKEEYCELVARLSKSIGLNVKELSKELKSEFLRTMDNISKPDSEFIHLDFDHSVKRLRLNYSLDEFKQDIWFSIKDLSNVERGKVLDIFGFELKNENGKLILSGFPNIDYSKERILHLKDTKLLDVVNDVQNYVMEFTRENQVNLKDYREAAQNITTIIKAFPEFITSFGKLQSNEHDFTIDIHTLKALQEVFKHPDYQNLSDKSKLHLQMAVLLHDLAKAEGIVDKNHSQNSSFDAYYILNKLELPEKEKLKIYQIIKNHTWLASCEGDISQVQKKLAFELSDSDAFKLLTILTEADMKAVKKGGEFYTKFEKKLQKAQKEISDLVYEVQKTAINLPQTRIPKAGKLNKNSPYVSEIIVDNIKNTVVRLNPSINLKEAGFSSDITLDDLNILVHGLDDKNSASMFQALGNVNSDALLSCSYINYGKGNWKVFRQQGFVLDVNSQNIHAGYWRDFGSGYKKTKDDIIKDYLFPSSETRSYFSHQLKNELNLNDKEYIDLYHKIEDLSMVELDEHYPEVAKAYRCIFANMETAKRSMGRNYNEILVTRPKIQAIFCWDKSPVKIPAYLRQFAQRHNLPILVFE